MPYIALKQKKEFQDVSIVDRTHPPVIATHTIAKEDDKKVEYPKGTILMNTDSGAAKYEQPEDNSTSVEIIGVLVDDYNSEFGDTANVLIHGCVVKELLKATEDEIKELQKQKEIYAI
jgi:hypothetical protein